MLRRKIYKKVDMGIFHHIKNEIRWPIITKMMDINE